MGLFDTVKGALGQVEAAAVPTLIDAALAKTNLGDREHCELGIGQSFAVVATGLGVARAPEVLWIGGIDEPALNTHGAHGVLEQVPRAAINVGRADEIVAGVTNILNCEQRRRLPRCQRQSSHSALERGHALLQHGLRRIHDAGIDVAELLEREQVGGVLSRIELVGGRLIDRHRDRRGGRVRAVARVQHDGFGMLAFSWHGSPKLTPRPLFLITIPQPIQRRAGWSTLARS